MFPRLARPLLAAAIALCACLPARGEWLLVPQSRAVGAGGRLDVTLFLPNDTDAERVVDLPARIRLQARGVPNAPQVVLSPVDPGLPPTARIAPGRFLRVPYAGTLPDALHGNLVLEPVGFEGTPVALAVADEGTVAAHEAGTVAPVEPNPPAAQRQAVAADGAGPEDRDTARFLSAFSPYEPNYFSAGSSGDTNARFQVSLKFRLFNPDTRTPFLEKLYLAYSQTSIWQIGESSAPFYDSSYRPSVFFLDDDVQQWPFRGPSRLGFQAGFEHESNGRDSADSRSMNIAYVRPTFTLPLGQDYFVSFSPKLYAYLEKEDNPDIGEYRGYGDYLVKLGALDGLQLATTLRKGTSRDAYSAQFDLSYPLKTATFGNLGGYLHVQFFEGYGESLLDYNRHVRPQFRVGLMITR
ncbi:MAG TPA: phospholipase A [Burkholderiales bacterium]|jgi:outer membrane phospholipase A|nr:phospholipase A [Burkholderiales bacterium]